MRRLLVWGTWLLTACEGGAAETDWPAQPDPLPEWRGPAEERPFDPPAPPEACMVACARNCVVDADCMPDHTCVTVTAAGERTCSSGYECNQQSDCADGNRCALPNDSFLGVCGDGLDFRICYSDRDCRSTARCMLGVEPTYPPERGLCSTGRAGTPCMSDDDCHVGRCLASTCSVGELANPCETDADCKAELWCALGACSDGSLLFPCRDDTECASGLYCREGHCWSDTAG